jgi:potassium-dependent mechanosensitive channel
VTARLLKHFIVAACVLLLSCVSALSYDEVKLKDAERMATLLQAQLRSVAGRIDGGTLTDEALVAQRTTLEKMRAAANVGAEKASGPLNEIATQVNELGPAPTDGQQETETIANQRKELTAQLARATAAQKQFVLIGLEVEQAQARLTSLQRGQFLQRIFKADKSILSPNLWVGTLEGASILQARIGNLLSRGLNEAQGRTNLSGFLLLPVGLAIMGILFFRLLPSLIARVGFAASKEPDQVYSGLEKLWHVIWSYAKYFFLVTVIFLLAYSAIEVAGFLTPPINNLLDKLMDAIEPALMYGGLLYFVASPRNPAMRLVAIDSAAARSLVFIVVAGYLTYGFGEQISAFATSINLPVSFAVGQSALTAIILIALIAIGLIIVRRQAAKGLASEGSTYFLTWFMNFMPLWWVLLGVAAVALLFGFIALSYFIAGNLLDTAILAVTIGVVHAFLDALAAACIDPHSRTGHAIRRFTNWSDQSIQRIVLILRTMADAILIVVGILALIALWTVVLFDVGSFLSSVGQGIKIGDITLSPKAIAIGLCILVIGITATKYFAQWLERRVLSQTQLDKGVRDSLRAVAGYTGYSLAAAFALTAAGLDFSSLALVAGALGVGIGFGLQSIVNNFVSGLILLAERPVRVGDWVVTNAGEGIVKKINVRSTEIETFDNCTIIVPNSNLISEAVRNWTHRDSVGRFFVGVTYSHRANAKEIQEKLLAIVQNHPKVMRHPPPLVQLAKISVTGYDFDIRGHLRDVFDAAQVTSDIRLAIVESVSADLLSSTLPPKPEEPTAKTVKKKL